MEAITQVIKGQDIQDKDAVYLLVKSLLKGDALQVFKNEETSQKIRMAQHLLNALRLSPNTSFPRKPTRRRKIHFPVLDRVTATKIVCKEFVDVLEDRVLYQWKLEFEKEGFDSISSTLKEFLD
eukprot:9932730-Ditylum_brightwellii.AAC.1